jgi:anti-sigma regulatory factor (Ser/Thr protein kinase)
MVIQRQSQTGEAGTTTPYTTTPPQAGTRPRAVGSGRVSTIRGRLTRILALPMVAVLVLLGVVVAGQLVDYRAAQATSRSVTLELGLQSLAEELQDERGLTSGLLGGDTGFRPALAPQRQRVDTERAAVAGLATADGSGAAAVRAALNQLDGLSSIRAQVDADRATRAATFQFYTERIAALNSVDLGLDDSPDQTLRRGTASLDALGQLQEYLTQERAFLNGVFSAGGFQAGEYAQFVGMYQGLLAAEQQFGKFGTPDRFAQGKAVQSSGAYQEAQTFEARALASGGVGPLMVDPQSWWSALTPVVDGLVNLERAVGADIEHRAASLRDAATRDLVGLGGLTLLCLFGALALVIVSARSITGPLAWLATEAEALASRRLPEAVAAVQSGSPERRPEAPPPVRVSRRAGAEIRSVAEALDRLQTTAYTLATEQARLRRNTTESLANLGRRNQNLLRRQLGFITRLESEETDPSGLANLFELDHLATRMRRNAESLLVLVGEASPRTWASAMPVADVIRAAISEVEEYRRVTLRRIDDGYVAGAFVAGIAHMVAELVENGLTFSPPDVDVEIQGRQVGNQYLIAIIDQGVGMEVPELVAANARLGGEEHFLMAPARFLGHYVVGQLARQMSIDVQLSPSPVTGITARVTLAARVMAPPPGIALSGTASSDAASSDPAWSSVTSSGGTGAFGTVPGIGRQGRGSGTGERPAVAPGSFADRGRTAGLPAVTSATRTAQLAMGARRAQAIFGDTRSIGTSSPGTGSIDTGLVDAVVVDEPAGGPAAGDATGAVLDDGPDRTRNGLLKRPRRMRVEAGSAAGHSGPRTVAGASRPAVLDGSPAQVRDRLVALRAGIARNTTEREENEERA